MIRTLVHKSGVTSTTLEKLALSDVLWFNLVRVEIHELRPEVVAEGEGVLVHYQSRTNM